MNRLKLIPVSMTEERDATETSTAQGFFLPNEPNLSNEVN